MVQKNLTLLCLYDANVVKQYRFFLTYALHLYMRTSQAFGLHAQNEKPVTHVQLQATVYPKGQDRKKATVHQRFNRYRREEQFDKASLEKIPAHHSIKGTWTTGNT
jgi:hypothetical protein